MSKPQQTMRTPLGKVRGLGSAKHGAGHFITQRVSAIGLIVLVPWFLISLIGAVRGGYDGALAWVADPINAVLTLLAVGTALYHMRLGMQVVVEDYITKHSTKNVLLILNTFICVVLFAAAAYAVLKIAIS
ncbi:MAG: succinate dehydrogenase, hydrophobic membrane anchor protein [Hyphomonadaceae bacterium]|nr:succinate dehydrogenase, hydrophobic membrane anchor protein [Hyphomonadaceae bacterium]